MHVLVQPFEDLFGRQFGRLVALFPAPSPGELYWICRCACDREVAVMNKHLRSGGTQSCGCLKAEMSSSRMRALTVKSSAEWQALLDTIHDEVLTKHPQTPRELRERLRDAWGHCDERRFWRALRTLVDEGRAERSGGIRSKYGNGSVYVRSAPWHSNLANCIADAAATYAVFELGMRRAA